MSTVCKLTLSDSHTVDCLCFSSLSSWKNERQDQVAQADERDIDAFDAMNGHFVLKVVAHCGFVLMMDMCMLIGSADIFKVFHLINYTKTEHTYNTHNQLKCTRTTKKKICKKKYIRTTSPH